MLTIITTAFASFRSLPKWMHIALAGVGAALLFLWWLDRHTDAAVEADRAESAIKVAVEASQAAIAASAAADATAAQIERDNARATATASGSSDPLKAGLDALK